MKKESIEKGKEEIQTLCNTCEKRGDCPVNGSLTLGQILFNDRRKHLRRKEVQK